MATDRYIKDILEELIDALEEKYGTIEGFECGVEHKQGLDGIEIAYINEFSISFLNKKYIDINDLK